VDGEGHVEVLGGGEDGVVVGMTERLGVVGERRDVAAARALADGALQLVRRRHRVAQRQVRRRDEPVAARAELADPPVVGARVGL
jgi:hypothetical protein